MTLAAWDALGEDERGWWIARYERERDTCQSHHGPRDECASPDKDWFPQRTVCYATMAQQAANRRYDELHKDMPFHDGTFSHWGKEYSTLTPFHYRDGVSVWVAPIDLSPDDKFLGSASEGRDSGAVNDGEDPADGR